MSKRKIKHAYLSYSILSAWQECPAKCYYENFLSIEPRDQVGNPSLSMDLGTTMHAGIEAHHKGEDIGAALDKAHEELGLPDEGKGCMAQVDELMNLYLQLAPEVDVYAVEEAYTMPISDRMSYRGRIDLIVRDVNGLSIVDHKTSSSLYSYLEYKIKTSHQFVGYMELLKHNVDENVNPYFHVHGLQTSLKTPKFKPYTEYRTEEQVKLFYAWVNKVGNDLIDTLESGVIPPMPGNHCRAYNRDCAFMSVCQLSKKEQEKVIKKSFVDKKRPYKGFEIVWG